ncbi:hypothetical protein [Novosphingobium rosa]|uniref:hypothetical protein n=1 Tax=Novosphingobium rosa TaxID=76978 RepID=UPI00082A3582|nr:hypothetical protein [Novosphingobium rosa]
MRYTTVNLNAVVAVGGASYVVARFRDAVAGESLGMGCFTGPTGPLGPIARLAPAGAQGNSAAIRSWRGTLTLTQAFNVPQTTLKSAASIPARH